MENKVWKQLKEENKGQSSDETVVIQNLETKQKEDGGLSKNVVLSVILGSIVIGLIIGIGIFTARGDKDKNQFFELAAEETRKPEETVRPTATALKETNIPTVTPLPTVSPTANVTPEPTPKSIQDEEPDEEPEETQPASTTKKPVSTVAPTSSATKEPEEVPPFKLTQETIDEFYNLNFRVPEFSSINSVNNEFLKSYIIASVRYSADLNYEYTTVNGVEYCMVKEADVKSMFYEDFGKVMRDFKPDQSTSPFCYFKNGVYYVITTEYGDGIFEFVAMQDFEDGSVDMIAQSTQDTNQFVHMHLKPANNKRGFIVLSKEINNNF